MFCQQMLAERLTRYINVLVVQPYFWHMYSVVNLSILRTANQWTLRSTEALGRTERVGM